MCHKNNLKWQNPSMRQIYLMCTLTDIKEAGFMTFYAASHQEAILGRGHVSIVYVFNVLNWLRRNTESICRHHKPSNVYRTYPIFGFERFGKIQMCISNNPMLSSWLNASGQVPVSQNIKVSLPVNRFFYQLKPAVWLWSCEAVLSITGVLCLRTKGQR